MKNSAKPRLLRTRTTLGLMAASLSLLIAAALPAARGANVISFNFAGTATAGNMNPGPVPPDGTGDIAGAPGVRTTNWNNINVVDATTPVTLYDGSVMDNSGSIVSGLNATLYPFTFTPYAGASSTAINEDKLYGYILDTQPSATTENSLQLTGIPYTNYFIFGYRAVEGTLTKPRAGYFSIRDTVTNYTYITNADLTLTTLTNVVTNWDATVWMRSATTTVPNLANPNNQGAGYVRSLTTVQPSDISQIQAGNYGVLPGDPNLEQVSYVTNIDVSTSSTNVIASTNSTVVNIYFTPVGSGLRGVTGGDTAQRFKAAGIQIVGVPTATLTNIYLLSPIPNLLSGNPTPTAFTPIGQYNDGDIFPLALLSSTTYSSSDTNIFTAASGLIYPGHAGTASLIITSDGFSSTQTVTVLAPTSVSMSFAPTNLFCDGVHPGDSGQITLMANFPGGDTNAAYTNINVTTFNTVQFTGTPADLVSVVPTGPSAGLVTAISTNGTTFSLQGTYEGLVATLNNAGTVTPFKAPGTLPSFAVDIADPTSIPNFRDLTGAPGVRQANWNYMNFTVPAGNAPSNAVVNPVDFQGNTLTGTVAVVTGVGFNLVTTALSTNEYRIMHSAYDDGASGGPTTASVERDIVVTNVPYPVYDAYFYFWNDSGNPTRVGHVTALETGETRWRANATSLPGSPDSIAPDPATGNGYMQAIPTISGGSIPNGVLYSDVSQVPPGNYIKFTGLTNPIAMFRWGPDGPDTVPGSNPTERLRLAGFQITKSLSALTPTNLYIGPVGNLLPGNPAGTAVSVFADFSDGTMGGNVSDLASYSSSNPSIFDVNSYGVITPGLTPGTADLIASYRGLSATQAVTTLAPVSVTIQSKPDTSYLDGAYGAQPGGLIMLATFPGQTNVNVTTFNSVSFNDISPAVASVSGTNIYASAQGVADLSGNYLGVSYTNLAGFTVTTNGAVTLKDRYSFRDAPGSTVIVDSVGGENGTLYPALGGYQPITLDGERANFPGDSTYTTEPYIALPPGLISSRGDVTIDFWCGMNQAKGWARIFDFGSTGKGTDPHNSGNGITSLFFSPKPGNNANPVFSGALPSGNFNLYGTNAFPIGTEEHVTLVYSYNQGVTKLYLNGELVATGSPLVPLQALNDQNLWLGASLWNDPSLNGWIDEFRIYEGAFSDADAAADDAAGPSAGLPPAVSLVPTNIFTSVSGDVLTLSWPTNHTGWTLQAQTNSLSKGLGTNWADVTGSAVTNQIRIPIASTNGAVFYRLIYKP